MTISYALPLLQKRRGPFLSQEPVYKGMMQQAVLLNKVCSGNVIGQHGSNFISVFLLALFTCLQFCFCYLVSCSSFSRAIHLLAFEAYSIKFLGIPFCIWFWYVKVISKISSTEIIPFWNSFHKFLIQYERNSCYLQTVLIFNEITSPSMYIISRKTNTQTPVLFIYQKTNPSDPKVTLFLYSHHWLITMVKS
jgi:hypothetical protein